MEQNTATLIELMREEAARHTQIAEALEAAALTLEKLGIAVPTPGFPAGGILHRPAPAPVVLNPVQAAGGPSFRKPNYGITEAIEKVIIERFLDRKYFTFDLIFAQVEGRFPELTKNTFHSSINVLQARYNVQRRSAGGRERSYLFTTLEHAAEQANDTPAPAPAAEQTPALADTPEHPVEALIKMSN